MMRNLLIRWLINTLAIYLAIRWVHGIHFSGGPEALLLVAAIFGLVNAVLKPILTVLTCPLVLLTLGLFTFVINALMLMFTARLSQSFGLGLSVDGFWPAFWAGLLIGVVSLVLSLVLGDHKVVVVGGEGLLGNGERGTGNGPDRVGPFSLPGQVLGGLPARRFRFQPRHRRIACHASHDRQEHRQQPLSRVNRAEQPPDAPRPHEGGNQAGDRTQGGHGTSSQSR